MSTAFASIEREEGTEQSRGFAAWLLAVYVFMLYSRTFEISQLIGFPNLYFMMLLSVIGLAAVLFKGSLARGAKTPAGIFLLLFTGWAIFILPFSSWKSESLDQLTSVWLKSLATFFIVVGLTSRFADVSRAIKAFGYGAAISAVLIALTTKNYGDRAVSFGSFGNSNEMAFHYVLGLPFLILLAAKSKPILKIPLMATALLSVVEILKTASRGGLVMALVVTAVALATVSAANKFKLGVIVVLAGVVGVLTINDTALERYKTLLGASDSSAEARSAKDSSDARKALLQMSIDLTWAHPIFGVGMGDFAPAAAAVSKDKGKRAQWQVTHNSYTQLSCETGILGAMLIVCALISCLAGLFKVGRDAKKLGLKDMRNMAICILLGFVALMVHFSFDALAYDFYFPLLAGLCTAFIYWARPIIEREKIGEIDPKRATAPIAPVLPALPAPARKFSPQAGPREDELAGIQSGNPYRFGRRRKILP